MRKLICLIALTVSVAVHLSATTLTGKCNDADRLHQPTTNRPKPRLQVMKQIGMGAALAIEKELYRD